MPDKNGAPPVDIPALKAQYRGMLEQADALVAPYAADVDKMPKEQSDQLNAILGKSDELKAKIDMVDRLTTSQQHAREEVPGVAMTSWRQSSPTEGKAKIDDKAWRETTAKTMWGTEVKTRYHVPFGTSGDEYRDAFETYIRHARYSEMTPREMKVLTEGVDNSGGFFIPEEYLAQLLIKAIGLTAIRPNARVLQVSRDVVRWPKINYTSAADDSTGNIYASPVRLTWSGEIPATAAAIRATEAVAGIYQIPIHTAMASVLISNDLMEDAAFDIQSVYADLLAEAFALGEDNAFLTGNGVARPMGLLTTPGVAGFIPTTTATTTNVIKGNDILNLFYNTPAQYRMNGKWYLNSGTMNAIEQLVDSQGRYLVQSMLNASLQTPMTWPLKGQPVMVDEFMPAVGTGNYPIVFGDMKGYAILDRVGLSVQRIDQLYAETNQTLLLARRRVGGQLVEPWKLQALAD
jgi:HK97 family phage major capsid protein